MVLAKKNQPTPPKKYYNALNNNISPLFHDR